MCAQADKGADFFCGSSRVDASCAARRLSASILGGAQHGHHGRDACTQGGRSAGSESAAKGARGEADLPVPSLQRKGRARGERARAREEAHQLEVLAQPLANREARARELQGRRAVERGAEGAELLRGELEGRQVARGVGHALLAGAPLLGGGREGEREGETST